MSSALSASTTVVRRLHGRVAHARARVPRAFDPESVPLEGSTDAKVKQFSESELPPLPPLPDLRELAKMAAMDISDAEVEAWTPQVHEIVKWFGELREIDLEGVGDYEAPGREGLMADDWMRDDEPVTFDNIEQMMEGSRFWDGKFVRVPAVGGAVATDFGDGDEDVSATTATPKVELTDELLGMELKIGRVLSVEDHPESEKLYVETVECGEDEPRTICSGLAPFMAKDDILGKLVIVVANLKARNLGGVPSNGMLLAASDASHENVELLSAPEGAVPGERVTWDGAENIAPHGVNKVAKKKIWEGVQKDLKTDAKKGANWNGVPMMTSAGQCVSLANSKSASVVNASVG